MVSIWGWDMRFSLIKVAVLSVFQIALSSLVLHAQSESSRTVADYKSLGIDINLVVEGNIKQICKDILGYEYPAAAIICKRNENRLAWQISTKGKHGLITSLVVIENGKVVNCRILSSREERGKQISKKRYLKQFTNLSLKKSNRLSKRVDAISGATISSKAVMSAVVLALRLSEESKAQN